MTEPGGKAVVDTAGIDDGYHQLPATSGSAGAGATLPNSFDVATYSREHVT